MTDVHAHSQPAAAPAAALTPRPGHVTAAGVVHIVAGALTILLGLIFLLAGAFIGGAVGLLGQGGPLQAWRASGVRIRTPC